MPIKIGWSEIQLMHLRCIYDPYLALIADADRQFEKTEHELQQAWTSEAAQIDEGLHDEFWESHADDVLEISDSKRILFGALFVGIWGLFKFRLLRICQGVQRRSGSTAVAINPRDYDMSRAKNDLKKLGFNVAIGSKDWNKAKDFEPIRHKLVHADGLIEFDWVDNLSKFADRKGLVRLPTHLRRRHHDDGTEKPILQLELTSTFCEEACKTLGRLLIEVHRKCDAAPQNSGPHDM